MEFEEELVKVPNVLLSKSIKQRKHLRFSSITGRGPEFLILIYTTGNTFESVSVSGFFRFGSLKVLKFLALAPLISE